MAANRVAATFQDCFGCAVPHGHNEFVHVVLRRQEPRYEKPPAQSDEEIVERAMASGV